MKEGNPEKECYKFPKSERLHHRSLTEGLFRSGKTFYEFPFRITWRKLGHEELQKNFRNRLPPGIGKIQILVTVPKKKRRKAVDRVLMRRRIREAYRLNRTELKQQTELNEEIATLSVAFVYVHNENLEYAYVEEKIKDVLMKLSRKLGIINS